MQRRLRKNRAKLYSFGDADVCRKDKPRKKFRRPFRRVCTARALLTRADGACTPERAGTLPTAGGHPQMHCSCGFLDPTHLRTHPRAGGVRCIPRTLVNKDCFSQREPATDSSPQANMGCFSPGVYLRKRRETIVETPL